MPSLQNLPQAALEIIFHGLIGRRPLPPALETAAPIVQNPHTGVQEREIFLLRAGSPRDIAYARYINDNQLYRIRDLISGNAALTFAATAWIRRLRANHYQFPKENFRIRSLRMAEMKWLIFTMNLSEFALSQITSIDARWVHETPPSYIPLHSALVDKDAAPDVFCSLRLNCDNLSSFEVEVDLESLKRLESNGVQRGARLQYASDFEDDGFEELKELKQLVESRPAHHVSVQDISTTVGQSLDDWLA